MPYATTPIDQRFWRFVDLPATDAENQCWAWKGYCAKNGYGKLAINRHGKKILAHRMSYEIHRGEIPEGMLVCHTCDVRNCVNPAHLFLGTAKANTQDMIQKGRRRSADQVVRGEDVQNSRLTEQQVAEIRRLGPEFSRAEIARIFGVGSSTISSILRGKTWRHVA